jgi:hypothetical protein
LVKNAVVFIITAFIQKSLDAIDEQRIPLAS